MKKYLCLLTLAAVLSAGTLLGGHLWVNSARNQYELTETVLAGDPAAAEGLSITYYSQDDGKHLAWRTTFTPGGADCAETDFRFSGKKTQDDVFALFGGTQVNLEPASASFGMSGGDPLSDTGPHRLLLKPFQDVASRTPANESRTETLRLADYYEYYPLTFSASGEEWIYDSTDSAETPRLGEYFRLKVPEGEMVDVTVEKDSGGEVYSIYMTANTDEGYLDSSGLVTKHGIFLIAESRDTYGNPDGRLECPDGPGVHYIPLQDPTSIRPEWFNLSKLRLFYPTGEAHALSLTVSPDESELLLYTEENGALRLTVLDTSTGEALQRLDLLDSGAGNHVHFLEDGDRGLYFALCEDSGRFSLVSREGGRYERVLRGDFDVPDDAEYEMVVLSPSELIWDGERMAIAAAARYSSYAYLTNLTAGVWDADGLRYLGTFDTGLGRDPSTWRRLWYRSSEIPLALELVRK